MNFPWSKPKKPASDPNRLIRLGNQMHQMMKEAPVADGDLVRSLVVFAFYTDIEEQRQAVVLELANIVRQEAALLALLKKLVVREHERLSNGAKDFPQVYALLTAFEEDDAKFLLGLEGLKTIVADTLLEDAKVALDGLNNGR